VLAQFLPTAAISSSWTEMIQKIQNVVKRKYLQNDFYLPHMKYGKVLVSLPKNHFFFANFNVLGYHTPRKDSFYFQIWITSPNEKLKF
jgi:hypothetical protein